MKGIVMKAILRDSKGWTKTMTLPYALQEIRLPLYRKHIDVFEIPDGSTAIAKTKDKEMVIFKLSGQGLSEGVAYYDEETYSGASER